VYLFQRRPQAAEGPGTGAEASEASLLLSAPPYRDALPPLNTSAIQPGSAAEWAIGELLIRLCNRGRPLLPEPPESSRE
jgi:hypothetical protein